ncbi:MAG TPA: substrate-binding domain-containing protein [Gaiellaceae bacterium]|nr:substrate-binding domain-containing protein [Gaiellaceae bacterium]
MQGFGWKRALLLVALVSTFGAFAATAQASSSASAYKVGVVYSRTGVLAAYGAEYIEGLRLGLLYATHGTNMVDGHPVQLNLQDTAADPATGVSEAKTLIGQGYKIIVGPVSSAVALQVAPLADQNHILFISGPAASDAITGINRYTFRSGRQSYQDVLAANSYLQGAGRKVVVFAQDYAFGQGNYAAVKAVLGGKGHTVTSILVPLTANDFTPFAQQVVQAKPDLLFVAWAGSTTAAMWQALQQQGVFKSTTVTTGLANRDTWKSYGPASDSIKFLCHYIPDGPSKKNKVNNWLIAKMKQRGQIPDLFTPDGFNAALMLVHALHKAGGDDVEKMISSLEGWKFLGPKGNMYIRPQDHALNQPMFQVALVKGSNGKYAAKVLKAIAPARVAPPITPFK